MSDLLERLHRKSAKDAKVRQREGRVRVGIGELSIAAGVCIGFRLRVSGLSLCAFASCALSR
jgi:hypothetical protein